ncbi:MAG: hypothetical protein RL470_758, partial [Actinomycetota bacterium]
MARNDGRAVDQLRDIKITRGWLDHAEGSVLVELNLERLAFSALHLSHQVFHVGSKIQVM